MATRLITSILQGLTDGGSTEYDLVGVVEHLGPSMRSGHYHAYTRGTAQLSSATTKPSEEDDEATPQPPSQVQDREEEQKSMDPVESSENSIDDKLAEDTREGSPEASKLPQENGMTNGGSTTDTVEKNDETVSSIDQDSFAESQDDIQDVREAEGRSREDVSNYQGNATESAKQLLGKKRTGGWYKISDHHYSKTSLQEVLASEAYVLLYARRQ